MNEINNEKNKAITINILYENKYFCQKKKKYNLNIKKNFKMNFITKKS